MFAAAVAAVAVAGRMETPEKPAEIRRSGQLVVVLCPSAQERSASSALEKTDRDRSQGP